MSLPVSCQALTAGNAGDASEGAHVTKGFCLCSKLSQGGLGTAAPPTTPPGTMGKDVTNGT